MASAMALGGCASAPPRPAMVPFAQTGDYGYSETRLAPDRYEVRYASPEVRVSTGYKAGPEGIPAQKQRAYDFALWRAAQIALEQGYPAFTVERDDRDAMVSVRTYPTYSPFWPYHPFYYDRYYPGFYAYYPYGGFGHPYDYHTRSSIEAEVVLKVQMHETPVEGSLDAADTAERLAKTYAGATYPAS